MAFIDRSAQRAILGKLLDVLPESCGLVLLGNTAGLHLGIPRITLTKDVDVSVVLLDDDRRVAPRERIDDILEALDVEPTAYPEDRSWVQTEIEIDGVPQQVDLIRGRKRDRPNGTFIHRDILNLVTAQATADGGVLVPPITDLVVLKAWAATDQHRLAEDAEGDERADALDRARAYEEDARRYADAALDRDALDRERIQSLLDAMRDHRRPEVRAVLVRAGAVEVDSDEPST